MKNVCGVRGSEITNRKCSFMVFQVGGDKWYKCGIRDGGGVVGEGHL